VLEIVELICELAGSGVAPDVRGSGTGAGEIDRQWVDSSKLRAAAGWEPKVDLQDGLRRTIAWYREHLSHRDAAAGRTQSEPASADHRG
jgi:CDP-glucose 4,6-dehydratase